MPAFKAQVLAREGVIFQKNTWMAGSWGRRVGVEREVEGAGLRRLAHVWMFSSFKPVGQSVSCQSDKKTHSSLLNKFVMTACFSHYSHDRGLLQESKPLNLSTTESSEMKLLPRKESTWGTFRRVTVGWVRFRLRL